MSHCNIKMLAAFDVKVDSTLSQSRFRDDMVDLSTFTAMFLKIGWIFVFVVKNFSLSADKTKYANNINYQQIYFKLLRGFIEMFTA